LWSNLGVEVRGRVIRACDMTPVPKSVPS
jgi:hypothetical protein